MKPCILLRLVRVPPRESKVADLELAVGIHHEVAGLEVAVEDVGRVDVLEPAQDLVDEGLVVGVGEGLSGSDDGVEIGLHQLLVQVELVVGLRVDDVHVVEAGDVFVVAKVLEELDLAQGALGEDLLAKDVGDLFDGDRLAAVACRVACRHHQAISTLTELFRDGEVVLDDKRLSVNVEGVSGLCHRGRGRMTLRSACRIACGGISVDE